MSRLLAQSGHPETSGIGPLSGAKQTTLESKPEREAALRRSLCLECAPPAPGCRAVRDSTLLAWYRSFYAPRTGGAYDSHHRTAEIVGRARRRGSRVAARGAGAAAKRGANRLAF